MRPTYSAPKFIKFRGLNQDSLENIGIKNISTKTITITLLVVRSLNFLPNFDSFGIST